MTSGSAGHRQRGVLGDWNDDRGFGFITPASGGSRLFVHVSAFPRGGRPVPGCEVTYVQVRDERRRVRASDVRYVSALRNRPTLGVGVLRAVGAALLFFALMGVLLSLGEVPGWLVGACGLMSAAAVVVYAADKAAAVRGGWRTSESSLHGVALLGGWPGALVARQVLRHKTTKQPFGTIFWGTVLLNCTALAWFVLQS